MTPLTGTIEEIARAADRILKSIHPAAFCEAQARDDRIDCCITMPDGNVIAEMVDMADATEQRITEAGERLMTRFFGFDIPLKNERHLSTD